MSSTRELPLVSILVGCYNHERYVEEALESVRHQTYKNIELIIWDDCSSDSSREKIESWIDRWEYKCTYIKNKKNIGLCASLNKAISKAHGKYINFFSADDLILDFKTEHQVAVMENLPESYALVFSRANCIDEDGNPMNLISGTNCDAPNDRQFDLLFQIQFLIPTMTVLMKRSCIEKIGWYDESLVMEDIDMWIRLVREYQFFHDERICGISRELNTSLSRSPLHYKKIGNSVRITRCKCLINGWLNVEQKKIAVMDLNHLIWSAYRNNSNIEGKYLKAYLKYSDEKLKIPIVFSYLMGIKQESFIKIKNNFYNIISKYKKLI
jgi:glycosyltransferase involved in cell wall biosynthesis